MPQTLNILAPKGIKALTDFSCAQWGMGSVWKESIKSVYPDLYCSSCIPPEYHYWASGIKEPNPTISLDTCNKLFYVSSNNHYYFSLIRDLTHSLLGK